MLIQFLTYANKANPLGIPAAWPAELRSVADGTAAPGAPWQQMTPAQFTSYMASNQSAYDAWKAAQDATQSTNLQTLSGQYDTAMNALQAFNALSTPTQAQTLSAVQTITQILLKLLPLLRSQYVSSL